MELNYFLGLFILYIQKNKYKIINVINYKNAIVKAKTIFHSFINALTLAQKELTRLKTKANMVLNLDLSQKGMMSFKKEDAI